MNHPTSHPNAVKCQYMMARTGSLRQKNGVLQPDDEYVYEEITYKLNSAGPQRIKMTFLPDIDGDATVVMKPMVVVHAVGIAYSK